MTRPEDPDDRMETHPDLVDPNWRKHAELDAWLGAKKEMKKRRKRERRSGVSAGYGHSSAQSRWPGVLALAVLVLLIVGAIVVHQIQGFGVNEHSIFDQFGLSAHPPVAEQPV
ncbi:hypothetical protein VSH64_23110 [Amycolatopsis rhabdoformis]|uniref:DUF3040 domain-containing protein n=1 Tax=Amycolatopsis rhabdoformis TaxID=1448059 RepID=A0ABZ1IKD3_9PSEU|nr:hypothetical protein [Amycolatopsis rhabdoformis]WSE34932.1 hypothetical protein VSH64_23110 [Amycolatopsis rhabdoformis]